MIDAVDEVSDVNIQARQELRERSQQAEPAAIDVRLLETLRAACEPTTRRSLVTAVLAGLEHGDGHAVSSEAVARRGADLDQVLKDTPPEGEVEGDVALALARDALGLVADGHLSGNGSVTDLASEIDALLDRRLPEAAALEERWEQVTGRSPWAIASVTLDRISHSVVTGMAQIRFNLSQADTGSSYNAAYTAAIADLRRDLEAQLARKLCENLTSGGDPRALDELFAEVEQAVVRSPVRLRNVELPELPAPSSPRSSLPPPALLPATTDRSLPAAHGELVMDYVVALEERLGDDAVDREVLVPALMELVELTRSVPLTDPDRVASAYATWKKGDVRKSLLPWKRPALEQATKGYLAFLTERGLAAPLPVGIVQSSQSVLRRIVNALSSAGLALGILSCVPAAVFIAALVLAPGAEGLALGSGASFADRLFAGGAFAAGSLVGPLLLGLSLSFYYRLLLGTVSPMSAGVSSIERFITLIVVLVATPLLVLSSHEGALVWLAEIPLIILSAVLAPMGPRAGVAGRAPDAAQPLGRLVRRPGVVLGADLSDGAVRLDPAPGDRRGRGRGPGPRRECPAVAGERPGRAGGRERGGGARTRRSDARGAGDGPTGRLRVRADVRVGGRAVADASTWVQAISCACVYQGTLGTWIRQLARSATDEPTWQRQIRMRGQTFSGTDLAGTLAAARRRLIVFGNLATAPMVAAATVLSGAMPHGTEIGVPVGLAALTLGAIAFDTLRAFGGSIINPFKSAQAAVSMESTHEADNGIEEYVTAAKQQITRYMGALVLLIVVLGNITDALGVWSLVEDIAEFLYNLVT